MERTDKRETRLWQNSRAIARGRSERVRTCFANHLGQETRVDARDTRHVKLGQPLRQRLVRAPVRVFVAVVGHDQTLGLDAVGLPVFGEAVAVLDARWHTVVPHNGVGAQQHLAAVGRVG